MTEKTAKRATLMETGSEPGVKAEVGVGADCSTGSVPCGREPRHLQFEPRFSVLPGGHGCWTSVTPDETGSERF